MGRKKGSSMFAEYEDQILAALNSGMTVKAIYREIVNPAMNGTCEYVSLLHYVNSNGLRYKANFDGYEVVPDCSECECCKSIERHTCGRAELRICTKMWREINYTVVHSPSWCPERDQKKQGEM